MNSTTFDAIIADYLPCLTRDLDVFFDTLELPQILDEACRYSIGAGGKRLRPLLVITTYFALGGRADLPEFGLARRCALAVELLHGYSLIHDDLPSMDNDALRRGKPTCHIAFGEGVALLAGDVLQAVAFEVLGCEHFAFGQIDEGLVAKALKVFAPRARRMVSGQMLDVLGEGKALDAQGLKAIHKDKTGALIEASVLMGAVCANAEPWAVALLADYAKVLGLAFQVQDDVFDVSYDSTHLGKSAGSDEKLDKSTYVKLLGVGEASAYADELFLQAHSIVQKLSQNYPNAYLLGQVIDWVGRRNM